MLLITFSIIPAVEPLIKDPLRKGQPLYKDTFHISKSVLLYDGVNTFSNSDKRQTPYKGQNS